MKNEIYYLNESDAIVNTLILINNKENRRVINNKENRRVIDKKDIQEFKNKFKVLCKENDIQVDFSMNPYIKDSLFEYITLEKEHNIAMLPWIDNKDLIGNCRGYLPLDICVLLCDEQLLNMLDNREDADLAKFKIIESDVATFYEANIKKDIDTYEKKKTDSIKKLVKIRELNRL